MGLRLLGIDEAGRGPVLGPLVVAGVVCEDEEELRALGVRDSKRLTPGQRETLAGEIKRVATSRVHHIAAAELDASMEGESLNRVEARVFAEIIRELAPDEAVVDCCDTVESRFEARILRDLGYELPLRAEHRADENHPVVSAASIVAKVDRDVEVRRIGRELGEPVGSGYAHDPATRAFLKRWIALHGEMPPYARMAWKTSQALLSVARTGKLEDWE
ncbi:MAG: ribonuclease HII [Thermoplasmata archaeon]